MKKIISLIVSFIIAFQLFCISGLNSYAEETIVLKVEAESYSSSTADGVVYDEEPSLSGGKCMGFYWVTPDEDEYLFEYTFNVPKTGVYSISAVGTERGGTHTTDWSV